MLKGKDRKNPYENIDTIISEHVLFKGDFNSEGSVRVDGGIEGQVRIKGYLVLGNKGYIKGDILGANILVSGLVEGTIVAEGRIEITSTGKIKGGVQCKTLVVEEGGIIQGNCKMLPDEDETKAAENVTRLYSAADY